MLQTIADSCYVTTLALNPILQIGQTGTARQQQTCCGVSEETNTLA